MVNHLKTKIWYSIIVMVQQDMNLKLDEVVRLLRQILLKTFTKDGLTTREMHIMFKVLDDNEITLEEYDNYCDTVVFNLDDDSINTTIHRINIF